MFGKSWSSIWISFIPKRLRLRKIAKLAASILSALDDGEIDQEELAQIIEQIFAIAAGR